MHHAMRNAQRDAIGQDAKLKDCVATMRNWTMQSVVAASSVAVTAMPDAKRAS